MNDVPLEKLTFDRFHALLKTKFRVHTGPQASVELELVEAMRSRTLPWQAGGNPASQAEAFSLIFHALDQVFLPQRMYRFEHEALGAFDLFIVPVGRAPGEFHYQAAFNRLV
jgi:hypothetical protein